MNQLAFYVHLASDRRANKAALRTRTLLYGRPIIKIQQVNHRKTTHDWAGTLGATRRKLLRTQ